MFKVECPGCQAAYQVDERRVAPTGMKMRCPKCGQTFEVQPPDEARMPGVSGAALGITAAKKGAASDADLPSRPKAPDPGLPAPVRKGPPPVPTRDKPQSPPARPAPADDAAADLPAVARPSADLPAPRPRPPVPTRAERVPAKVGADSAELPATIARKPEADLPARAPAPRGAADLPTRSQPNLPSPRKDSGTVGLPSPRPHGSGANLPSPAAPGSGLPSPAAPGSGLPEKRPSGGRPSPTELELDLPPTDPSEPPPRRPSFGELELELPRPEAVVPPRAPEVTAPPRVAPVEDGLDLDFGDPSAPAEAAQPEASSQGAQAEEGGLLLSLPPEPGPGLGEGLEADPFGEVELPPPRSVSPPRGVATTETDVAEPTSTTMRSESPSDSAPRAPVQWGEVSLEGGAAEDSLSLDAADEKPPGGEEDMEFGEVPQEHAVPQATALTAQHVPVAGVPVRTGGRLLLKLGAGLFALTLGGAALSLAPSLGPFGAYFVIDKLKAGEYRTLVDATTKAARAGLQADTALSARDAWKRVEAARARAKRVPALAAYSAVVGLTRELRFGPDPEGHARAVVALDEIGDAGDVRFLPLALSARSAIDGQLARARKDLLSILKGSPKDIDALVIRAEVELRARDAAAARTAWEQVSELEDSARAAFGLARAEYAAHDQEKADQHAEETLKKNPEHVGARLLRARIASEERAREADAITWLTSVVADARRASPQELVSAHTLLGDIHLERSRISKAEDAYIKALKIDPKAARALTGLGDTLYRAGRFSEAQARFEAGVQADPDDLTAKVGVARSKLMLERVEEARTSLAKLKGAHPDSVLVAYWYGRSLEALGSREEAEKAYQSVLEKGKPTDPLLVDVYVGLAMLQNQQGQADKAEKTLARAREKLPESATIHRALGEVATAQGRYAEARTELERALSLDAEDLGARFHLAVALRRDDKLDDARRVFDQVAKVDPEYPGLALERGMLYEASGHTQEALRAYEGALAKAPEDPDLMLRVGCGYAVAGRTKEAEQLLKKVLATRPTSAETHHCLGRALLMEGSRLADALRILERAADLDPHRAEYHLYAGWAANEAGNVAKAERSLQKALELDQGLADAYWQRGVLRERQGAVRDAVADLKKALELRPSRHEAHAALADAYYDLGREPEALSEWKLAVSAFPDNGTWHFRYGKLLAANHMNDAAEHELSRALDLAEKTAEPERWLWEAHHLLARAIGLRAQAVPHWEAFLKLGPHESPYRAEAKAALDKLGHPWTQN